MNGTGTAKLAKSNRNCWSCTLLLLLIFFFFARRPVMMMCVVLTTLPSFSFSIAVTEVWNFYFFWCKILKFLLLGVDRVICPTNFLNFILSILLSKFNLYIFVIVTSIIKEENLEANLKKITSVFMCEKQEYYFKIIFKSKELEFKNRSTFVSSNLMFLMIILNYKEKEHYSCEHSHSKTFNNITLDK